MQVNSQIDAAGRLLVCVAGQFDLSTVPTWRSAMSSLLDDGALDDSPNASGDVVVDLVEIEFIDSAGLGSLVGLRRRVHERGGSMVLVVGEVVANALRASDLDRVFDIDPSARDDAPASAAPWGTSPIVEAVEP